MANDDKKDGNLISWVLFGVIMMLLAFSAMSQVDLNAEGKPESNTETIARLQQKREAYDKAWQDEKNRYETQVLIDRSKR